MKKLLASVWTLAVFGLAEPALAQWAFSGADIKNTNSGNVIIGNAVSRNKLSISGGLILNDAANLNKTFIIGYNATKDYAFLSPWDWGANQWKNLAINAGGGSVGINTAPSSLYSLWVAGTTRTTELIVDTGWPDFVFQEGYPLPPLAEVAEFIQKNRHLPGIPSEAQVAQEGVRVGQMQARLLQKIEELTLYIIAQDKALAGLREDNRDLADRLRELEERLASP